MGMYCFQCQETAMGKGCTVKGVCGKTDEVANLQDLLLWVTKGLSIRLIESEKKGINVQKDWGDFIATNLFTTITNANFDPENLQSRILATLEFRNSLPLPQGAAECAVWNGENAPDMLSKASTVGVLTEKDENIRSLIELIIYGLKGMAAYMHHAAMLGAVSSELYNYLRDTLAFLVIPHDIDTLVAKTLETGSFGVKAMALLDGANTARYGNPEITKVKLSVDKKPGILVSGHDLKDLEELLIATQGTGIDIYTHGEMLPAHYYPELKKYTHLVGNYGSSWWHQNEDFSSFNGPILMTTNCIVPVKGDYLERLFVTGATGYPGAHRIPEREGTNSKDFSSLLAVAKKCKSPTNIEDGTIVGGFAHSQVLALADKVIAAVKSGAVKKFVVMAGCDGRMKNREYYTNFANELPKDTIILTAGCAKYRYNKLNLGDIGGIPRVLDAGQCNDSYSLALIALALKDAFGLDDINKLPIVYNIAWYEQKAVIVLLALLSLGVKNIHIGPTLPAFLSPAVTDVLVKNFGLAGITNVKDDIASMILA